ncbi:MAG: DUF3108 domain-containing protein [Syntrophales bacterium]|nr:DUF3108 domain-containing protein [Syntrophales bacterium]
MLFFLLVLSIFSTDLKGEAAARPLAAWKGERLVFALSWFNIPAGISVAEAVDAEDFQGKKMLRLSIISASNKVIDAFYKVRDSIFSYVFADTLASRVFEVHQREGSYRGDKEIIFDYANKTATFRKNEDVSIHSIPGFVSDSLSAFYYFRTKELVVGKSVTIDVFDDKKLWQVEVHILSKERIQTPAGVFNTILIKPLLKFEGIFQRKGDVYIWVTDDHRRMPVRMKSKVVIGSFYADLIQYQQ